MTSSNRRGGFVIVAVLIAGISGLWVATSLLFLAQSDVRSAEVTMARTQHRSLGLSGLRLLADVLVDQRQELLAGQAPVVDSQYSLWDDGDREGVVRLLPFGSGGERLVGEAGRLDINHATVEQLSSLPMMDVGQAQAVVEARQSRSDQRFHSIHDLLAIEGIEAQDLFGDLSEEESMDQALGLEGDLAERVEQRLQVAGSRGLVDVLTVYGFEPNLQRSGRRRIDLNVPWSDELARRVTERFGEGAAQALEQIFQETSFDEDAKIVRVLRDFQVPTREWVDPLDALTTRSDVHVAGRLDLNTASADTMETLPGIDRSLADRLVSERESLDEQERASIAWPVLRDVLSPEAFEAIADLVTVRSWTWRVRVAAGTVAADDPDGPIEHAVVYEAVIDLADPRPRLGYLREITMLQTASRLAAALEVERDLDRQPLENVDVEMEGTLVGPVEEPDLFPDETNDLDAWASMDDNPELDEEESQDQAPDVLADPASSEEKNSHRVGRWLP
ncbi:MAG: helix-hairpin-helix domain-containing protein [Planctomycetota bacterium]|nr:helix-hairpin-helix domain-containing protein [Planctomycetota bacterium]